MTDAELAAYLNVPLEFIPRICPVGRATYERLAVLESEIAAWQAGVAPKPTDAIICGPREIKGAGGAR